MGDLHDAVAGDDAEDREEPDHGAQRQDAAAEEGRRQHTADERHRQRDEREHPEAQALEHHDEQHEDAGRRDQAVEQQVAVLLLALDVLTGHLGVVAERQLHLRQLGVDVVGDRGEVATLDVRSHLDGP